MIEFTNCVYCGKPHLNHEIGIELCAQHFECNCKVSYYIADYKEKNLSWHAHHCRVWKVAAYLDGLYISASAEKEGPAGPQGCS